MSDPVDASDNFDRSFAEMDGAMMMSKFSELDIDRQNDEYLRACDDELAASADAQMVVKWGPGGPVDLRSFEILVGKQGAMRLQWRDPYQAPDVNLCVVDLPPAIAQQLRPLFDE
jgi:hypothetical protein